MIDSLVQYSLLTSFIGSTLLLAQPLLTRNVDRLTQYRLWLIFPLGILMLAAAKSSVHLPTLQIFTVSVKHKTAGATGTFNYSELLVWGWLAVAAALAVMLVVNHIGFLQRLKIDNRQIEQKRIGPGMARVTHSAGVTSPFIIGFWRTVVILPQDFSARYTPSQQRLILQHELTHQQRGDLWWNAMAQLFICVFWFNPLIWLCYRHFRQAQELACDEAVTGNQPASLKAEYARAMLQAAGPQKISPYVLHYGEKSMLEKRVKSLMSASKPSRVRVTAAWLVACIVTLSASWAMAGSAAKSEISGIPLERIEPVYPLHAIDKQQEGSVTLKFDIETDGTVSNVSVVGSTPQGVFDRSAKIALRQWVYEKPQQKISDVLVQLDFVLSDESGQHRISKHKEETELLLVKKH